MTLKNSQRALRTYCTMNMLVPLVRPICSMRPQQFGVSHFSWCRPESENLLCLWGSNHIWRPQPHYLVWILVSLPCPGLGRQNIADLMGHA